MAAELEGIYGRARELCDNVTDTPHRFTVLRGLWSSTFMRKPLTEAQDLSAELVTLANAQGNDTRRALAYRAQGCSLLYHGEFEFGWESFRQGIDLWDVDKTRGKILIYGDDPGVLGKAWSSWFVGAVYSDMTTGQPDECLLDVKIVARDGRPFRCFGNVLVEPHGSVDGIEKIDVAIVCDMYTPTDTPLRGRYQREIAWLKRMHAGGSILASACSGSLLLAEAGLLDGIECAGHWGYRDLFREHYPKVKFREDSILRIASEDARIVTAGGVASATCLSSRTARRQQHVIETIEHGRRGFGRR